jgi:hypothetical protein
VCKDYFENKDVRVREILVSPWGQRNPTEERVKEMLTAVVYEGTAPEDAGGFVAAFAREQACIREHDAREHRDLVAEMSHKQRPLASMEAYLNMNEERGCMDRICEIGSKSGLKVGAYEHDGISGMGWGSVVGKCNEQGIFVKEKPVPRSLEEFLVLARAAHPEFPWTSPAEQKTAVSDMKADPIHRAIRSISTKGHVNHMAFAQVILRELGPHYVLEREDREVLVVQWFHEEQRVWKRAGGARRLRQKAYEILNEKVGRGSCRGMGGVSGGERGGQLVYSLGLGRSSGGGCTFFRSCVVLRA